MTDYPAAHSMDTEWFAVDANGHIALFDSGEGGAVPKSTDSIFRSATGDGFDILLGEIAKECEHRTIEVNTSGEQLIAELTPARLKEFSRSGNELMLYDMLLMLESDRVIQQLGIEQIAGSYIIRFAGEQPIVYVNRCLRTKLSELIQSERVIAGKSLYGDYDRPIVALFGCFEYRHDSHALIPYDRSRVPQFPFRLEDLPDRLQELITLNWFDRVKFAESELVQPIEHTPCDAWGDTRYWIDTQGCEHQPEDLLRNTWNPIDKTWIDENGVEY